MVKAGQKFEWNGPQGEYIKKLVKDRKLSSSCSKEDYRKIYTVSEGDTLKFQNFTRSWENAERNLKKLGDIKGSTGTRKAKASDGATKTPNRESKAPKLPQTPPGARSTVKRGGTSSKGTLFATGDLTWETLWSYWTDKYNNSRLTMFVVLPSGCRPKDITVGVKPGGRVIPIEYTWPQYMFNSQRVFEGQTQNYGSGVATSGSSKAVGLDTTTQKMKPTNKSVVLTKMKIDLESKVEDTLVDMEGKATTKPFFYKIADDEWDQYPMLVMAVGLMVKRAVNNAFVQEEEEEMDFA